MTALRVQNLAMLMSRTTVCTQETEQVRLVCFGLFTFVAQIVLSLTQTALLQKQTNLPLVTWPASRVAGCGPSCGWTTGCSS